MNKRGYVSKETKQRVLRVVKALGYHPTRSARGLASKTSGNIGFVLRDDHFSHAEPFYTRVFLGAEFAASQAGFYLLLTTINHDFAERDELPRFLLERNVDGLIVAGKVSLPFMAKAARSGIPIVLVDFELKQRRFPAVLIDNRSGTRAAVSHLITEGHKEIAFVGGDIDHPSLAERFEGYRDALTEKGIVVPTHFVDIREADSRMANGASAMRRLLRHQPRPTAIVAANDAMAIGCMQEITRAGLTVPNDIALAGFDDIEMSGLMRPPLTTLRVFKEELGREAVDTLVEIIRSGNPALVTKHVPVELIIRESTAGLVPAVLKHIDQDQVK